MKKKKILQKFAHVIIPHEKNNNIPHILRAEAVFILVVFVGVLFYFNQNNLKIIKGLNLTATVYPAVLADLANSDRLGSGVPELSWNKTLEEAAKLKAEDMAKNEYFAHTSPTGITPWHWLSQVDYNFIYAGENLAVDFTESENVENAWLNSPKHRENIMNQNFTEIGIATAEGVYNGRSTTFVVEFFGKPLKFADNTSNNITKESATTGKEEKATDENVAGASAENLSEEIKSTETNTTPEVKVIEETDKFIAVENNVIQNEMSEVPSNSAIAETYGNNEKNTKLSTWSDRFIVSPTKTIEYIYIAILGLVLVATTLMLKKEYQRHHRKHLTMGLVLMIVIIVLICTISINGSSLML